MSIAPSSRRVAIFGATSDIATAVARRYAEAGWRVLLIGRDQAALEALAADLQVRGAPDSPVLLADFADLAALPALADEAWSHFAGLDAALLAYGAMAEQKDAERDAGLAAAMLTVNFTSAALLLNALALRFEAQRHGAIAAISSVAGDRGRKSNYVYGAAKAGLQRFLEGLRHRLAAAGVGVVDVRPGFTLTKMTAHLGGSGPLWASPGKVAADIVRAIEKGQAVCYTPWFWRLIMLIIRALPRFIFHRTPI